MAAFYPLEPGSEAASGSDGLQVICAGLPRCGTNSLKHALQCLGYPTCHMMDIIWWEDRQKKSIALYEAGDDVAKRRAILRGLYDGFSACCDAPSPSFVDDLMDMYPDAKVVLNQRSDASVWARSFNDCILPFCSVRYWFFGLLMRLDRLHCRFTRLYVQHLRRHLGIITPSRHVKSTESPGHASLFYEWALGPFEKNDSDNDDDLGDGEHQLPWLEEAYRRHNSWVRDEAARRGGRPVLEWRPEDGWEPLCAFLGVSLPFERERSQDNAEVNRMQGDTTVPFPHNNESRSLRKIFDQQILKGLWRWLALAGTVILGASAGFTFRQRQ